MAKGGRSSKGGNTKGVPSNKKPTTAGGGGGILSAPGDQPKASGPITVDPKTSRKATIKNMKGGKVGKGK